jgi:osmotically-inducible protein OsmY
MIDNGFQDVLGQVKSKLAESPFAPVRRITVKYLNETIRLNGSVESFYYKQLAQEAVRSATRGLKVINDVTVDRSVMHP